MGSRKLINFEQVWIFQGGYKFDKHLFACYITVHIYYAISRHAAIEAFKYLSDTYLDSLTIQDSRS